MPKISAKFDRGHPIRGREMQVGCVKIGDFRQITGYISKTVQDRRMVSNFLLKSNRKSYALYRMVTLPMTLIAPKPPHFLHFAPPFIASWWVNLETSNLVLVNWATIAIPTLTIKVFTERGVVRISWPVLEFYTPCKISATDNARDFKFCTRVGHANLRSLSLVMSECSLNGRGQGHVSNFYIVHLENFATASRM